MAVQLNPPNFATGSSGSNSKFKGSHANKAGDVDRLFNSTGNYVNGEVKSIFLANAPVAGTAGSCSFAGGTGMSLGNLAADTMYEFPGITQVSASTAEVFVFKN
tara:strand:+ start:50 stop:361 length:312 start_codon:yes stop_codon:yes gene_type:complete